jgi:hypothetical protein
LHHQLHRLHPLLPTTTTTTHSRRLAPSTTGKYQHHHQPQPPTAATTHHHYYHHYHIPLTTTTHHSMSSPPPPPPPPPPHTPTTITYPPPPFTTTTTHRDDRVDNGFCGSCNLEAQLGFASLTIRACNDFSATLAHAGDTANATKYITHSVQPSIYSVQPNYLSAQRYHPPLLQTCRTLETLDCATRTPTRSLIGVKCFLLFI